MKALRTELTSQTAELSTVISVLTADAESSLQEAAIRDTIVSSVKVL